MALGNSGARPPIPSVPVGARPCPSTPSSAQTDQGRRNLRKIMEAIGCLKCPALEVIRGRNANDYGCLRGGCDRQRVALAIIKAHQAKAAPASAPEAKP